MDQGTVKVYTGMITEHRCGENDEALFISDERDPLAEVVEDDIAAHGKFLSVRYFISDERKTLDQLETGLLDHLEGVGDADYGDRYSEMTGVSLDG
jgi:hypothetical protein